MILFWSIACSFFGLLYLVASVLIAEGGDRFEL